jgi:hypothetical protein
MSPFCFCPFQWLALSTWCGENLTVWQAQEMGYVLYRTILWNYDFLMVIIKTLCLPIVHLWSYIKQDLQRINMVEKQKHSATFGKVSHVEFQQTL